MNSLSYTTMSDETVQATIRAARAARMYIKLEDDGRRVEIRQHCTGDITFTGFEQDPDHWFIGADLTRWRPALVGRLN